MVYFALSFVLVFHSVEAFSPVEKIYLQYNSDYISREEISQWLNQFDYEDHADAVFLLNRIDYYSYNKLIIALKQLHQKVLTKLKEDGFIPNVEKEYLFENVDFSKTYSAKSGDLVSYFYRSANKIRASSFKNLEELEHNQQNKENRVLVLLDDYVGTGTQFLMINYANRNADLFNKYKKIYFVTLVANVSADERFSKVKCGDHDSIAEDFIKFLSVTDENEKKIIKEKVRKISQEKLELVYLNKEYPINDPVRDPETAKRINRLLDKYNIVRYMDGNFSCFGHTVFFYNCPNNVPEILWSPKCLKRDGASWNPLFKRTEDISIYKIAETIPVEEHVW